MSKIVAVFEKYYITGLCKCTAYKDQTLNFTDKTLYLRTTVPAKLKKEYQ